MTINVRLTAQRPRLQAVHAAVLAISRLHETVCLYGAQASTQSARQEHSNGMRLSTCFHSQICSDSGALF